MAEGGRHSSTAPGPSEPPRPPADRRWRPSAIRSATLYVLIPAAAGLSFASTQGISASGIADYLPTAAVFLSYSFARMTAAYALSLAFALAYGYYAATHRTGERVMIPILDILQSIPILGFFPIAILFFAALTPNSWPGVNLASVFLIFTSMAWNMVFGVYESLKTLPSELTEAAQTFRVRGLLLFRRVLLPATMNRLIYNTVLSWTAGWFFLVEAEIFTTNSTTVLPGIGSFLSFSASDHNYDAFVAGLLVLTILIAILDFVVWRPLSKWGERFRYDTSPAGEGDLVSATAEGANRFRRAATYVTRGVRTGLSRLSTPLAQVAAVAIRPLPPESRRRSWLSWIGVGVVLVIGWLILIALVVAIYGVFTKPIEPDVLQKIELLPLAMGASALRVLAAFGISVAISLPLALYLARRKRAERIGMPIIEVVASFPATALFPVIIFLLIPYITAEGAAVLMLTTGMIWYLFFNVLSGVRSLPPDLEEAARSFGLRGRKLLARVILPGLFPAFITGAITAFGGGWNTLIVAEYLNVQNGSSTEVLSLFGIGQSIDIGYALPNQEGYPLMVAALLVLVATVVAINEVIWKPLYRRAVEKYRYD